MVQKKSPFIQKNIFAVYGEDVFFSEKNTARAVAF